MADKREKDEAEFLTAMRKLFVANPMKAEYILVPEDTIAGVMEFHSVSREDAINMMDAACSGDFNPIGAE